MITILRKEGWDLNPNDKIVNAILNRCEINNGYCPCVHEEVDDIEKTKCPCVEYREEDHCRCNLYVKL
jgi:ferredoxin-thioredoxin reductase catalytic subunit